MTPHAHDAPSAGSAEPLGADRRTGEGGTPPRSTAGPAALVGALAAFSRQVFAIAWAETRKLRRDPMELFTRAVQPALWLGVFGVVMARSRAIPTGNLPYMDFMVPGILAQSVLFVSIFYGISLIWERDLGILHTYLASPAYRGALVGGKAVSAGVRAVAQALIVGVLAALMGAHLRVSPLPLAGAVGFIVLGAAIFSTFSLAIACLVKTRERFMGIGQVLTMPLFFASNAIYPLTLMPRWLQVLSRANPLTYQVDALRALMLHEGQSAMGLGTDLAVEGAVLLLLVAVAARLYPTVIQ
ncbi:MAG TPA: ABC transporter permease [Thermoanaerobaculaceae bacterium]|nr:ABC transporter permease [Thermoanaerobaculaceae bacterium]